MTEQSILSSDESLEERISRIEKDVETLKGSIKKLLIDLREILNNLENPFQNLQDIAEGLIPIKQIDENKPKQRSEESIKDTREDKERAEKKTEEKKTVVEEIKTETQFDIIKLLNTVEWVKKALEKYDSNTLKTLLDVLELSGLISPDFKKTVIKLIDLLSLDYCIDEMILDLYRLYKIINPEDRSLDSKILELLIKRW